MIGAMDASQIRALRAAIAASCEDEATRAKRSVLARLFAQKDAPVRTGGRSTPPSPGEAPAFPREEDEAATVADAPFAAIPLEECAAQSLLLLGLGPRRTAFGQRREQVMELVDVTPTPSSLVRLGPPDGAALAGPDGFGADAAPATSHRRIFQAAISEAPFFPEDLEDVPRRRAPSRRTPCSGADAVAAPPKGMAATFLLARLAARLAHEAAVLNARLASIRPAGV
jgi:hypothetical protein